MEDRNHFFFFLRAPIQLSEPSHLRDGKSEAEGGEINNLSHTECGCLGWELNSRLLNTDLGKQNEYVLWRDIDGSEP